MLLFFWLMVLIIFYVYVAYPFLISIFSKTAHIKSKRNLEFLPLLTLIIAAHNEEKVIKEKVENSLDLDYSKDNLEIIVASDASTDRTNEIVKNYSDKGIKLYDQKEHKGKSAALNHVVEKMARGEIIVFNDATTL